jgi:hypothetical protein
MAPTAEKAVVRKSVRVPVPVERAFSIFVEQMETWWPATHHIAPNPFQSIIIEPRAGGRWYERDAQGNDCLWGFVRAWDPPGFVTLSWHLQSDWAFHPDPARASDIDLRFTAEGAAATLVELTHYNLERHGEGYAEFRDSLDGPGAWTLILDLYAAEFAKAAAKETTA